MNELMIYDLLLINLINFFVFSKCTLSPLYSCSPVHHSPPNRESESSSQKLNVALDSNL